MSDAMKKRASDSDGCWKLYAFVSTRSGGLISEAYDGLQVVGMDLHRHRSVLVRMTSDGGKLETAHITNSPAALRRVIAPGGEAPEGDGGGNVWVVLGGRHADRGRCGGTPGPPAGGAGLRLPAGREQSHRGGANLAAVQCGQDGLGFSGSGAPIRSLCAPRSTGSAGSAGRPDHCGGGQRRSGGATISSRKGDRSRRT